MKAGEQGAEDASGGDAAVRMEQQPEPQLARVSRV